MKDPKYSLKEMLVDGRKFEMSVAQAEGIEENFETKAPVKEIKAKQQKCHYCGFTCNYPHPTRQCPAKKSLCNKCRIKGHFAKVCNQAKQKNYHGD